LAASEGYGVRERERERDNLMDVLFAKCILCKFYDAAESLKLLAAGFGENFI
jgi:hypothetical protein